MRLRTMLQGCFLAIATLIAAGLTSLTAQAAPVSTSATKALNGLSTSSDGNVVLVQRRRRDYRRGRRAGRRGVRRGRRAVRRNTRRRVYRRGVRQARRWGRRGRRYRRGNRWYFWAPWAGTYLYFGSYDACYRTCRARGYSSPYCSDLCVY